MTAMRQMVREIGLSEDKIDDCVVGMLSNVKSGMYQEMSLNFKEYLGTAKRAEEAAVNSGGKITVRVPYGVDILQMRDLESDYPEFKVEFARRDKLMTGVGAARWYLETQSLMHRLAGHREGVVYMSDVMEHVVLRNRHYIHTCMSKATAEAQVNAMASHRAIAAFGARTVRAPGTREVKGPLTPVVSNESFQKWAKHDGVFCCMERDRCTFRAPVMLFDYSQYGLCWEQHAMSMKNHGACRAFSMIPMDDLILAQCDGYSEALEAWILFQTADDDTVSFTVHYDRDYLKSRKYDYEAYKHFLMTAAIRYGGKTYYREFVDQRPGYLACSTTVVDSEVVVDQDPALNRLWMTNNFSRMTAVVSYELKDPKLDPTQRRNYRRDILHVDKDVKDKIIQSARGLDVKTFTESKVLEVSRVHMKRALVLAGSKFVQGDPLHERVLRKVAHVVYVRVWDERHATTVVGTRLRNDLMKIRKNSERGLAPLLVSYIGRVLKDELTQACETVLLTDCHETWRERIRRVEAAEHLLPWFEDAYEFIEVQSSAVTVKYEPFSGSYVHFDPTLPGGFLRRYATVQETVMDTNYGKDWVKFKVEEKLKQAQEEAVGAGFVNTLFEEVPESPVKEMTKDAEEILVKMTGLHDVNGMGDVPDDPVEVREDLSCDRPEDLPETTVVYENPLGLLQAFSDEFGNSAGQTRELDEMLLHTADISITISPDKLDISLSSVEAHKPRDVFRPKLVTNAPPKALQSFEQTMFSLASRNTDTPMVYEPMDPKLVWEDHVKPAVDAYLGPIGLAKSQEYRNNPVLRDAKQIGDWLMTRDPEVFRQLKTMDFDPGEEDLRKYNLMLKDTRKPQLTKGSCATMKPTQTINYHGKEQVGNWSPVFRRVAKRFQDLVRHRAFVSMLKSPEELVEELNRRLCNAEEGELKVHALDHNSYDKSQGRVAKFCEFMFYVKCLGLDEDLADEWFEGQFEGEMSSAAVGIRLLIEMQRRTGDATTALGNTVINFLSFVTLMEGWNEDVEFDGFMGDDMVRFSKGDIPDMNLEQRMNSMFNFSVKEIKSSVAYYLSGFIVKASGVWLWVPDVVKVMIKMGDPLPPEEELILDRWTSFKDRMKVFKNDEVVNRTAAVVEKWYEMDYGVVSLGISALWSCAKQYSSFRNCWSNVKSRLMI